MDELAAECTGYCGADLKALCAEAALTAVQRRYPQIYQSDKKLRIDESTVVVARDDFALARRKIVPSLHRSSKNYARSLSTVLEPLLRPAAAAIVRPTPVLNKTALACSLFVFVFCSNLASCDRRFGLAVAHW